MSAAKKECITLPGVCVQEVMGRIVEGVIANGPKVNGKNAPEVSTMVLLGAQSVSKALPNIETAQDLRDIHAKAEAVAVLAVWQLIILGAYVNAQKNEMQAADAATKH